MSRDSRRRRHYRRDEMCASATALAAFEIAVAGRCATLAFLQNVLVHSETHRASGVAPFEPGVNEYSRQAFFLGLSFDLHRAWNNHRIYVTADAVTFYDPCRFAEVFDPRI